MVLESEKVKHDQRFITGATQVAQGMTWFGVGIIIGSVLEYAMQGYIAIRLNTEGFGLFGLGQRITTIVTIIASMAMPGAMAYFIPRLKAKNDYKNINGLVSFSIGLTLFVSVILGFVLFLAADFISNNLLNESRLTTVIRLFALTVPASSLVLVMLGNLRGLKRSREASLLSSTYERALRLGFVVLLFELGLTLAAPPLAFVLSATIVAAIGVYYIYRTGIHFVMPRPNRDLAREVSTYTWPVWISQVLNQAIPSVQPLLLARFYDAHVVGLYSVAWLIAPRLFSLIATAFGFLYVPVTAGMTSANDRTNMQRLYNLVSTWQLIAILPSYLLMVSFPRHFLMLFGSEYQDATSAQVVLATSALINVVFGPVGSTLLAAGNTGIYLFVNIIGTIVSFGVGLLFIPLFGLLGAALGHAITATIWNTIAWLFVYRHYRLSPFRHQLLIVIAVALVMWIPLYFVVRYITRFMPWSVLVALPIFSSLFVLILIRFHLLDNDSQQVVEQFTKMLLQKRDALLKVSKSKINITTQENSDRFHK